MSLAYLSGFAKWEGVEVLPFSFFSLASRSGGGGRERAAGGRGKLSLSTALPLGQRENDSPVFGEMLSRSYGTPVVSVGERRDFSHSLTVFPLRTA